MLLNGLATDLPSAAQLLAAVPVIAATAALLNVRVLTRNERRRSQPVVVVHPRGRPSGQSDPSQWCVMCVLRNEGGGPAFNVRFGVSGRAVCLHVV
jgi:hypothetical protein